MEEFRTILKPHQQKAIDNSEMSHLKQATIEHNILALSKVYKNISFERLSQLLQIPDDNHLEQVVTRMISGNLLCASIDQIDRIITFKGTLFILWDIMIFEYICLINFVLGDELTWDNYIGRVLGSIKLNLTSA